MSATEPMARTKVDTMGQEETAQKYQLHSYTLKTADDMK